MSNAFASGVTSADIQALHKRFDELEKLIKDKVNIVPQTTTQDTTTLGVTGLSGILPPSSQVNISDIFPKGGRRKHSRKHSRKRSKNKKSI